MRAVGIILAGGNSNKMRELTHKRAVAAMPIAGSYRAIDFALSNMSNSHIQKVAVLTQYNARSYLPRRSPRRTDTGTAEQQTQFIRIWIS